MNDLIRRTTSISNLIDSLLDFNMDWPMRPLRYPSVEVVEDNGQIKIEAEVPGLSPSEINVTLDGDFLTISAQKNESEKGENYSSRRRSSLYRSFRVGKIDPDKVQAKVENGLLSVVLPSAKSEVRKIEVRSQ